MNIIVTGGLGFIGTHFLEILRKKTQYNIFCVDKETYAANINFKKTKYIKFIRCDISNLNKLESIFKMIQPALVVNIAAETHVDNSICTPKPFIDTNINGVFNLLELSRKYKINKFVQISTDEVYGDISNINDEAFKETDILEPSSVYSSSKSSADLIALSYFRTYGLNVCITRCSNNYGPRQHFEKLIPKAIKNILNNNNVPIYGNGKNMREWIYVTDHCNAILQVLNKGKAGEIYNIGSNALMSNIDLVKTILLKMNKPLNLIEFVKDRKGHDFIYHINSNKIINELEWRPEINFEEGIMKTIDFYTDLYYNKCL
jgi:dTDP-glucose 4,6-dehydratase